MIPLSVPNLAGNEWKYVKECLDTNWISSVGSYVNRFEQETAKFCGVKHAVATANGTAAIHISLLLAGVQRGDLVVLPNITFVAPANAIKYVGADPLLIDVDEETWQLDTEMLGRFLKDDAEVRGGMCYHKPSGRRIAAVLPVHVLGNMCEVDELQRLANEYELPIIEDSSEALGSYYKGKHAGSFGLFGCLSYNGNKIISTGGGGMILCNDEELARKAKHLTTQAKADSAEYFHDEVGYNYRLVNLLAAVGVAQMEQLNGFLKRKREIADEYNSFFKTVKGAKPQTVHPSVQPNNWLYTVQLPSQSEVRQFLQQRKIEVRPFWVPMNRLPAFRADLYIHSHDVSGTIYSSCLSLPCSTGLLAAQQQEVIHYLREFYHG